MGRATCHNCGMEVSLAVCFNNLGEDMRKALANFNRKTSFIGEYDGSKEEDPKDPKTS